MAAALSVFSPSSPANAASDDDFVSYSVEPFAFDLPKSWKVIVNKKPSNNDDEAASSKKRKSDGKFFSAIDFSTGAVVTVVEEYICSPSEYADALKQCDILANGGNSGNNLPFSSPETLSRDISKLLIRHDDRDNAALQGTTTLEAVEAADTNSGGGNDKTSWNILATTQIPSGGTYQDGLGLEQPNMIARTVKAKVIKVGSESNRIVSLWFTVPTDDWNKPTTGLKLREIWKSVSLS